MVRYRQIAENLLRQLADPQGVRGDGADVGEARGAIDRRRAGAATGAAAGAAAGSGAEITLAGRGDLGGPAGRNGQGAGGNREQGFQFEAGHRFPPCAGP